MVIVNTSFLYWNLVAPLEVQLYELQSFGDPTGPTITPFDLLKCNNTINRPFQKLAKFSSEESHWQMCTHLYTLKLGETVPTDICVPSATWCWGQSTATQQATMDKIHQQVSHGVPNNHSEQARSTKELLETPHNPARGRGMEWCTIWRMGGTQMTIWSMLLSIVFETGLHLS